MLDTLFYQGLPSAHSDEGFSFTTHHSGSLDGILRLIFFRPPTVQREVRCDNENLRQCCGSATCAPLKHHPLSSASHFTETMLLVLARLLARGSNPTPLPVPPTTPPPPPPPPPPPTAPSSPPRSVLAPPSVASPHSLSGSSNPTPPRLVSAVMSGKCKHSDCLCIAGTFEAIGTLICSNPICRHPWVSHIPGSPANMNKPPKISKCKSPLSFAGILLMDAQYGPLAHSLLNV